MRETESLYATMETLLDGFSEDRIALEKCSRGEKYQQNYSSKLRKEWNTECGYNQCITILSVGQPKHRIIYQAILR